MPIAQSDHFCAVRFLKVTKLLRGNTNIRKISDTLLGILKTPFTLWSTGVMSRGVVLRKLLVGLTGFTGPLHCTTFDFMFRFWKFCSELRFSTF